MRFTSLFFSFYLTTSAVLSAGEPPVGHARKSWLKGNYGEARVAYEKLATNRKYRIEGAIGVSRCWRSVGEYDKALGVLKLALKSAPKNSDLLAETADLLYFRGQWDDARFAAIDALDANEKQFLAHWVLARLYTDQGKLVSADRELLWFIRIYSQRQNQGKSIADPEELSLVGLAAVERARRDPRLKDQFQFVLARVWNAALKQDEDYWPARYYRGLLFHEKHDRSLAFKELNKALVINPQAAEVYAAKGFSSLRRFQISEAETYADQALQINPRLPAALRLKADVFLTAGDTAKAMEYLDKALKVNPRNEPTLARVAACLYVKRQPTKLAKLVKQVEEANPKCAEFYHELGQQLEVRKHYADAEKYFRKAVALRPKLTKSRHELGLLYMRLGKENEAKKILQSSFADDPFHVRVYNTLEVLDHLENYATLRTPHFVLRYDPVNDRVLARVMAKYLEEIYDELAEKFQYRLKEPTLIEVFNHHQMFSGRVIALPDLHTIGACTGRMIAMVSPLDKAGVVAKPYNWNRVLRHELVHVFNLEQTNFLVPHWVTEGLAVQAENLPMPPLWYRLLLERVPSGDLLNLDDIHLGFIRPGTSDDWHLAYLQSKLYIDYLTETYGEKAIGGVLEAYRDGLSTEAVLQKVTNASKAEFEKGYRGYLQELVEDFSGQIAQKPATFTQLKERYNRRPNDPDVAAALAEHYFLLGNKTRADELSKRALAQSKNHRVALYVQGRVLLAKGDETAARRRLQQASAGKQPSIKALKLLGKLEFEAKEFSAAATIFEQGHAVQSYDNYWLGQMIQCYKQTGEETKLIAACKKYAPTDADDLYSRRYVAAAFAKRGKHKEAERYARQVLEIDVLDGQAQKILLESLKAQDKVQEMEEWRKLFAGK